MMVFARKKAPPQTPPHKGEGLNLPLSHHLNRRFSKSPRWLGQQASRKLAPPPRGEGFRGGVFLFLMPSARFSPASQVTTHD